MMDLTKTISQTLLPVQQALAALTDSCYHYKAAPNAVPDYIVWAEDGDNDLSANDKHMERAITGSVDLYTKNENSPLKDSIPAALEAAGAAWYFSSFQFETETSMLHFEWVFEVA